MTTHSIRPEDILADGVDSTIINGKTIRKGTAGAFLANIELLEQPDASEQQKQNALSALQELAPALVTLGFHNHVQFKNKQVEKIILDLTRD